jgi:hypothetical protein
LPETIVFVPRRSRSNTRYWPAISNVCDALKRRSMVLLPASNGAQSWFDSDFVPSPQSHSRLGQ